MALDKLILIRHAERPTSDGKNGVTEAGSACPHSLTVKGWERAGALVPLLRRPAAHASALAIPSALFACPATAEAPSMRSLQTLQPLSAVLGLPINASVQKGDEAVLAAQLRQMSGVALVAWSHHGLPALARAYLEGADAVARVPSDWPEDRFDLVWVVDGPIGRRQFRELPQALMGGDRGLDARRPSSCA